MTPFFSLFVPLPFTKYQYDIWGIFISSSFDQTYDDDVAWLLLQETGKNSISYVDDLEYRTSNLFVWISVVYGQHHVDASIKVLAHMTQFGD